MSNDVKAILRRQSAMESARAPHETIWAECFELTYPERASGLNGGVVSSSDAQAKKNKILDSTAPDSCQILGSGMVSGTTPSNSLWFGIDAGQETDEEKRWLDNASKTIFENIHTANFDACAYEAVLDEVVAGWFVLYIDEAKEGGYHFEQWPISQCYIASSKPGGLVDTIHRKVELTVEQVVTEYGIDNVSDQVAQNYRNDKFDEKVTVLHAIHPRKLHVVGGKTKRNLPFASCHIEVASGKLLREGGYHEFPCAVPRWRLIPGTPYATGPVSNALGDIRTLNDIKALELAGMDVAVTGMWIAEDDGVLNPRAVKLGPRKVIVANSVDSMKPLTTGANFQVAFTSEERLQASIRKILLADQLQPQDGPAMTATEVHVRVQLIRQLLGPIYGRLQAEYLQPMIIRCFGLAYRAGVLGQAPQSLQNRSYSVKYISPLARAQKLEEVQAIDQYVAGIAATAQLFPERLDHVDVEAADRIRGEALGVPSAVIPSPKAIAEKRAAKAQAQEAAQGQAMQQEIMAKAAPAMMQKAIAA